MLEITFDYRHGTATTGGTRRTKERNIDLMRRRGSNKPQSRDDPISEILFCDVPYDVCVVRPHVVDVLPRTLTLQEFYQTHRLLLPTGVRSIFRARISQTTTLPSLSITLRQKPMLSYRDTRNAIGILNPWFRYTEILHQIRTEYSFSYRSIDMLSTQTLNKDLLRELLVLLYGQKFMFTAPDLYTEFHLFLSEFNSKFKDRPKQVWINLKRLKATYGDRKVVDNTNANPRYPSVGSLSTIPRSNTSLKNEKVTSNILIEV